MQSLVVFFALAAVACGSIVPLAQPAHHPALVLDPHGRPLDTAEVINARAIHLQAKALDAHHAPLVHAAVAPVAAAVVAPAVHSYAAPALVAAPAAVSHQSRVDVRHSSAIVAPLVTAHAAPIVAAHTAYSSPLLSHSAHGFSGHGHFLKKRSLGHIAYSAPLVSHAVAAPILAHVAPAALSHQSRVDVVSSPAVVSHAIATPLVAAHAAPVVAAHTAYSSPLLSHSAHGFSGHGHFLKKRSLGHIAYSAPLVSHAVAAPIVAHVAPAAVSHQSRVDVVSSPAVVSHAIATPLVAAHAAPVVAAHTAYSSPLLSHSAHGFSGHGHFLKKRSLGHIAYSAPLASHAVAAPIVAHVAPAAVSHQSRVDVRTSPAVIAHSVHATPLLSAHSILAPAHVSGHLYKRSAAAAPADSIEYYANAL